MYVGAAYLTYMRYLLFVAALTLAACGSPTTPSPEPEPIKPFSVVLNAPGSAQDALETAIARWNGVAACSGYQIAPTGVLVLEPFTVDSNGAASIASAYGRVGGYFLTADRSIHVVGSVDWAISWDHEIVHAILFAETGDGDINHTSPLFAKCAKGY